MDRSTLALSDASLEALLREDAPFGDLTTGALRLGAAPAVLTMSVRAPARICGTEEAARLFELVGARAELLAASGNDVAASAPLLQARGSAAALHLAWKTAQTLIERLSGVASSAAALLAALSSEGFNLPLLCTRKAFPGTRALAHKAICAGGAGAHRLGLSETLLVFAEHRVFFGADELAGRFAELKRRYPEKKLVAEACDLDEARLLAGSGVDVLQLERFTPEQLAECRGELRRRGLRPLLAPAGGVTVSNAVAYARAGADLLVSSAPYLAPPCDVLVRLVPVGVPAETRRSKEPQP